MTTLLVLRERMKKLYAAHSLAAVRIVRGVFCLLMFLIINGKIGYMSRLHHLWLPILLAAVSAFLPWSLVTFMTSLYVLAHMYAVSLEVFLVVLAVLMLMLCFYYVFRPEDSIFLLLVPMAFALKLPFLVPLCMGLLCSVHSMAPALCGTFLYCMLYHVEQNVSVLATTGSLTMSGRFMEMINGTVGSTATWISLISVAVTLLFIYVVRRLSVNYAWRIAIIAGPLLNAILVIGGAFAFDLEPALLVDILNILAAVAVGFVLEFLLFHQDYAQTEYVQFEDDDYYYYVKAVPKISMTQPEVTVQKINPQNIRYGAGGEELFTLHKDSGNGANMMSAGRDLEESRNAFENQPVPSYEEADETTGELPKLPPE